MQTIKRLPLWQKVLGAVAIAGSGWWLYTSQKKKTKKTESVPAEPAEPQPQEPTPEGLGGTRPPGPLQFRKTVKRKVYTESDNQNMPAPVRVRMVDNGNGTFDVVFNYQGGSETFTHHTRQAADLRFESMVKMPSEWNCTNLSYDSTFDGWICQAGYQPNDMVARGFHDTERGPAPWFVTWDGSKFTAQFMPDLQAATQTLGTFDDLFAAVQEASGA